MSDEHSHPLLAQVPLTVSPFVSLPTATTLPYTYKSLPSTLPPSSTGPPPSSSAAAAAAAAAASASSSSGTSRPSGDTGKPKYVVSATGRAAHPDDIVASCQALQAHLQKLQKDAEQALQTWEDQIKERELAEKRRLAPGWLDSNEKMLQPARASNPSPSPLVSAPSLMDTPEPESEPRSDHDAAGEELDRAFGTMNIKTSG